jgi:hypothetical protein
MTTVWDVVRLGALTTACAIAAPAMAAFSVTAGNQNSGTEQVKSSGCTGVPVAVGFEAFGCLNSDASTLVRITAGEAFDFAGGQASIDPVDGQMSWFAISMVDAFDLTKAVINIDAISNGYVRFNVDGTDSAEFAVNGNGQNFFTLVGAPSFGQFTVTSLSLNGTDFVESENIMSSAQLRVAVVPAVPEPESVAMLLAGLGLVGWKARRSSRR